MRLLGAATVSAVLTRFSKYRVTQVPGAGRTAGGNAAITDEREEVGGMEKTRPVLLTILTDPLIRRDVGNCLEEGGYTVLEAKSGREGLRLWRETDVRLLLVDLQLADIDGLAILTEVRGKDGDLPVIVLSGDDGAGVVEALRLGATDYLLTPIPKMWMLLYAVERGLERARLVDEGKTCQGLEEEVAAKTEELSSLYRRLQKVIDSTMKLIGCGEIDESGPMILAEFGRHLGANGGSLYEVGENELRWICSLEGGHAAKKLQQPLDDGTVFSRALTSDEPFIIDNIDRQDWLTSGWSGYTSPSCIVFPLWDRQDRIFAVISLHNPSHDRFAPHDREIGAILASYVAEALQTAAAVAAMKRHEERMLQSQKLEAMGTLAGGIAHDFNNILSAIVGYTDLSLLARGLPGAVKKNLEQIMVASQRARELVSQIVSFSRVEASLAAVIDMVPIVTEVLKLLRSSIPSSIKIKKEGAVDSCWIEADPSRIHQVVMNLCTNGAQAMRKRGGTLTIDIARVEAAAAGEEGPGRLRGRDCIRLRVADTGEGIPAEALSRIFDPYFTTKNKEEGTGLGLAVVQGIVHGAGGEVVVESQVGRGSRFSVYFPLANSDTQRTSQAPVGKAVMPVGSERILFVDDEETLAEMAGEMLKKLGYTVKTMTNSVETLQLLETSMDQYDLIITDQTMPGLSGVELARRIGELGSLLPVILYSGYSSAVTDEDARKAGICKVLMKPLSMALLSQTVRQILDRQRRQ
ncbi:MAG: response regulator [Desulfopila sp.]